MNYSGLNTAFSDVLKLFIEFQSIIETKNLFQKHLTSQIDCLASSKRGYSEITNLADPDIRNAISHGGVKTKGKTISFSYRIGRDNYSKDISVYEFKNTLLKLFDGISSVLLAWIGYLCEENISYNEIYENENVHEDTATFYEKLSLSTLLTTCDRVWQVEINNQKNKHQQINVEFSGVDLDINSRMFFGLHAAERIFQLRKLSVEDSIMISFHSPKIINSFFIVDCTIISDLSNDIIDIEEATRIVLKSKNIIMFPINIEDRSEFEDQFRRYSDIETDDFLITEIEDISTETKKRFKAVVYLKRAKRRNHVQKAVDSIIETIKVLENYGFTSNKVKHGKMKTDFIYLVLYKQETNLAKERNLSPSNNNFIAQIQYDVDKKFPIRNNFVDKNLKKRRIKTVEYNWNPNF